MNHFDVNVHLDDARADRLLAQHGLEAACLRANDDGLTILDLMRRHMAPVAHLPYERACDSPYAHELMRFLKRVQAAVDPDAGQNNIITQLTLSWHMCRYQLYGRRAYVVESGLSRQLLATGLRGLKGTDLRLPYTSIFVEIDPDLGFKVFNEDTGYHDLYGLYVTEDSGYWAFMLCGAQAPGQPSFDDALTNFAIRLDDRPVDQCVDDYRDYVLGREAAWVEDRGLAVGDTAVLFDSWAAVFYWTMNLVFYVTHSDAGEHMDLNRHAAALLSRIKRLPPKSKKRAKLNTRLRGLDRQRRIVVGRGVKAAKDMPRTVGEARTLLTRTLVAGHWQRYAVGPGRVDRRWVFKQPFWRGQGEEGPNVHEIR